MPGTSCFRMTGASNAETSFDLTGFVVAAGTATAVPHATVTASAQHDRDDRGLLPLASHALNLHPARNATQSGGPAGGGNATGAAAGGGGGHDVSPSVGRAGRSAGPLLRRDARHDTHAPAH